MIGYNLAILGPLFMFCFNDEGGIQHSTIDIPYLF